MIYVIQGVLNRSHKTNLSLSSCAVENIHRAQSVIVLGIIMHQDSSVHQIWQEGWTRGIYLGSSIFILAYLHTCPPPHILWNSKRLKLCKNNTIIRDGCISELLREFPLKISRNFGESLSSFNRLLAISSNLLYKITKKICAKKDTFLEAYFICLKK